jgi:chemotaxis signal transduction protein
MELPSSSSVRGKPHSDISRWVGFEVASQAFALRIGCVREVVPVASVDPVPGAPRFVLGVAALRGRIVSVLDLHGRLQIETPQRLGDAGQHCLIVVESGGEALALRVDRIGQLYALERESIKPPPTVPCGVRRFAVDAARPRCTGRHHLHPLIRTASQEIAMAIVLQFSPKPASIAPRTARLAKVAASLCDFCDLLGRELGGSVTRRHSPAAVAMPLSRRRGEA